MVAVSGKAPLRLGISGALGSLFEWCRIIDDEACQCWLVGVMQWDERFDYIVIILKQVDGANSDDAPAATYAHCTGCGQVQGRAGADGHPFAGKLLPISCCTVPFGGVFASGLQHVLAACDVRRRECCLTDGFTHTTGPSSDGRGAVVLPPDGGMAAAPGVSRLSGRRRHPAAAANACAHGVLHPSGEHVVRGYIQDASFMSCVTLSLSASVNRLL